MQRFSRETAFARNFCWEQTLPTERALGCRALHLFFPHLFLPSGTPSTGLVEERGRKSFIRVCIWPELGHVSSQCKQVGSRYQRQK